MTTTYMLADGSRLAFSADSAARWSEGRIELMTGRDGVLALIALALEGLVVNRKVEQHAELRSKS